MKSSVICFVASKSGGHIIPCLTLAQRYKENNPTIRTALICGTSWLDNTIAASTSYIDDIFGLDIPPLPGKAFWKWPKFILKFSHALWRSYQFLKYVKATHLISTGSFITIPTACAARLLGIPVELYELNAIPGKAVRVAAPLASTINICFEQTQHFFSSPCTLVPYPLRQTTPIDRTTAQEQLSLNNNKKIVFIMGGSQGSRFINQLWADWIILNHNEAHQLQIIHQTGTNDPFDWVAFYEKQNMHALLFDFTNNLSSYYAVADVAICRAGAGTLFELKSYGLPALIIPLARRISTHQIENAHALARTTPYFHVLEQEILEKDTTIFNQALRKIFAKFSN